MESMLIADSGSSKTEWCYISGGKKQQFNTEGLSPYFLSGEKIKAVLSGGVIKKLGTKTPAEIYFYGTGCSNPGNRKIVQQAFKSVFPDATTTVEHDLTGAARALCGHEKGIACILGTGSNSCYYNGKKVARNSPGLGFILGDEGSGAYLGKKVIQYFLYNTFDPELMDRFHGMFHTNAAEILDAVYKKPLPNKYLAGYAMFLSENRGHYMVENIIEDAFNDFFFNHIYKYSESWTTPINFTGSVAHGFADVLQDMCTAYELQLGKVLKHPMDGLIQYHHS